MKLYKKQDDRLLKQLSFADRKLQETIRKSILSESFLTFA
jgi:hypothetical protein